MERRWPSRFPDLLVLGQETWGPVKRRNQLLIETLAARNPRSRFLFIEQSLRPREARAWRWPHPCQVAPNIWTVRPVRPVPDGISKQLSDAVECRQIRQTAKHLGIENAMLWSQDPRAAALTARLPIAGVIHDLTDDWAAFEEDAQRRGEVSAQIETLTRQADLVLACSRWLEDQARARSDFVLYLPNAVDPPAEETQTPPELEHTPSPRLGYSGTLHGARVDVSLVARAAELRPDWSFVFVGPNLLGSRENAQLSRLANVYCLGPRPHPQVASYISQFDVCLLPNRVTDFTRSLDPLKLYEYMAAGRPVIATPAGIPVELSEHVTTVTTAEQLVIEAERALDDDAQTSVAARRALVDGQTWDARASLIEGALGVAPPASDSVDVSAVIVSFNTRALLERCLTALHEHADCALQTIVVDNASNDGSRELVRDRFPQVELLELPENVGFARANNLAFERCAGRYVLLLNSDAMLHDGALQALIAAAQRHPSSAVLGPRLLNPDGSLQRSAWPFPNAGRILLEAVGIHRLLRQLGLLEDLGLWAHDEERPVDFLIGACLLLRADALSEVGGFDESFWLYGEEADLQRRLANRGWASFLAPDAVVTHVGAASSKRSLLRLRQFYAGQKRFLEKHGSVLAWPTARAALLIGSVLRRRWGAVRVALKLS